MIYIINVTGGYYKRLGKEEFVIPTKGGIQFFQVVAKPQIKLLQCRLSFEQDKLKEWDA